MLRILFLFSFNSLFISPYMPEACPMTHVKNVYFYNFYDFFYFCQDSFYEVYPNHPTILKLKTLSFVYLDQLKTRITKPDLISLFTIDKFWHTIYSHVLPYIQIKLVYDWFFSFLKVKIIFHFFPNRCKNVTNTHRLDSQDILGELK